MDEHPGAGEGAQNVTPAAAAEPAQEKQAAPLGFVKDGTTTAASDNMFAALWQDAEKRRDEEQAAKEIAAVPLDQGGGMMLEHPLTTQPGIPKAFLLLKYLTSRGEPAHDGNGRDIECLADLVMESSGEMILILVCPRCIKRPNFHMDQAQIQVRSSNRRFHFVPAVGSPTFMFEGRRYPSAGMVMESEPFNCPCCTWRARIDKNRVWPDS